AGGFRMGEAVHDTTAQTLDFLLDLNVRALMPIAASVVPRMVAGGGGQIVTVGAMGALKGGAQMGAYAASKSALMRLTESMSAELKVQGINVNCVMPSIIDTPENRAAMPDADPSQWVAPEALADVMLFLASDAARAIHGACIPVTALV
ncbi:MAG: SDR family oxidoreductase, partial [Hydrogenophaga sp.]|nr:SDR family oxidoreductase [Hydrogenophaga sp.]